MSLRRIIYNRSYNQDSRGVAQPGSAPALGAGGPRFKSARPDQILSYLLSKTFRRASLDILNRFVISSL
jgi:hypothetical protein